MLKYKTLILVYPWQIMFEVEEFLLLLEECEKLYCYFFLIKSNDVPQEYAHLFGTKNVADDGSGDDNHSDEVDGEDEDVFEVEKILELCYGDPKEIFFFFLNK